MSDQPPSAPPPLPGNPPPLPVDDPGPPPPPAAAGSNESAARTHALQHDSQATRTYPCNSCGGELVFHIGEQRLRCPHCSNVQDLAEVTGQLVENDLHAALAAKARGTETVQVVGEKEIVCQNCGGHTTFTGTLTSTRCPYCATPIQRDDIQDAPARLPVDGVLPFKVDDRQAKEALEKWVKSRWFAPSEFKTYSKAGSFASVYTAYFTYDAQASTRYRGERGDTYTYTTGSGENKQTHTETRWSPASGTVHNTFDDLPVSANDGLDEKKVEALEPWPMDQVRPYSPEFAAGHLSRTYDHDVEECFAVAQQRMESEITSTIRRDIGGDQQRIHSQNTSWSGLTFKHILLPIWLLTVTYDGRPFQVMINGATGEVQGERPYSKVKIAAAVLLAVIVAVVAFLIYSSGNG